MLFKAVAITVVLWLSHKQQSHAERKRKSKRKGKQCKDGCPLQLLDKPRVIIECMNVEDRLPLPNMNVPSNLLTDDHIRKLMPHFVSNAVGHDWHSVYSTYNDGFSLHTLYRNMTQFEFEDTATLLIVQDSYGKIFGAMVPCPLRISDRFYGTGDSFLFSFDGDNVLVYPWTGENDYVIKGSPDSIAFGSGDGFFGLWLDENLYHGSSSKCLTYNNEPLATLQDYYINGLEAWGFTT